MIKTSKFLNTFSSGIDMDSSVNKTKPSFYFDSENMRIISNEPLASGALNNVAGNEKRLVFDVGDQIIGYCKIRSNYTEPTKDSIVFFVYNATGISSKIYLFEGDPFMCSDEILMNPVFAAKTDSNGYLYKCGYIYANSDLGFLPTYPIKAEGRYESATLRKIYWVDGLNNIRYMILDRVDSGDPVSVFDINPTVTMSMPTGTIIPGGAYKSGMVQYSYQLYIRNGAATTFAPPSELLALTSNDSGSDTRTFSGSDLGQNTSRAVRVNITDLDPNYNRVRIIAIYYTEYLVNPVINIVGEVEYSSDTGAGTDINFIDNGYTIYGTIPIEEFRLFGQVTYKANYLASKYNYLLYGDITEDKWNPVWLDPTNVIYWDARAIRFRKTGSPYAYLTDTTETAVTITKPTDLLDPATWDTAGWDDYAIDHDGINNYNDISNDGNAVFEFKYMANGSTPGAEGPNVSITFDYEYLRIDDTTTASGYYSYLNKNNYDDSPVRSTHVSSQRTEVYRMYIVFYNTKMQYSDPQWIIDLRMPTNSDSSMIWSTAGGGQKDAMYIYPKVTIRNLPVDSELYGWQIFRCDRDAVDRSVLAQGVISGMDYTTWDGHAIARPYSDDNTPYCFIRSEDSPAAFTERLIEVISPEISFNKDIRFVDGDYIRVDGRYATHTSHIEDISNSSLVTLSLGVTTAVDAADTILNTVMDGKYQSPGITYGSLIYPSDQLIGDITYRHTLRYGNYYGNRGSSFVACLDNSLTTNAAHRGFIMGSYVRNVFYTQYGGNTYEARSYNSVIPYSELVPVTDTHLTCYRGDTHISMFAYLRSSKANITYSITRLYQQEMIYIPCESSINCFYRLDQIQKYYKYDELGYALQETVEQGLVLEPLDYPLELGDLYRYNPIYSKSGNANLIQNLIFDSNTEEHSDVKIIATGKKINNEYFDNWTNLYTNNYIELDPKYGSLHNIWSLNNKLFAGQDKAIAVVAVNDRSMIQDNNKIQLTLGTGGVLERYDYITTTSGFQDYFDVVCSDKTFYYLDRRNKIIYQMTEKGDEPISEINGYRSFLKSHGAIVDAKTGFDPVYKEVFMYIEDGVLDKTSVLNEYTNSFNGKHTFTPDRMLNINDQFYSIKDNNLWIHNYGNYGEFYGVVSDSTLTIIINPDGNNVDRFDTLELRVDVIDVDGVTYLELEQFNHLELSNNYQTLLKSLTFDVTGLTEDTSKSLIRKWRIPLIPDDDATDVVRLVDTFLKAKFIRHNTDNKRFVFHDIITYYRNTKN